MSIEDIAQTHEAAEWERRQNANANKKRVYTPSEPGYGPAECFECGEDMHAVRRGYGYQACVQCQSALERKSKLFSVA
jgi:hypothetical protein